MIKVMATRFKRSPPGRTKHKLGIGYIDMTLEMLVQMESERSMKYEYRDSENE